MRLRRRSTVVWLTLLALLLQQFALAAHACERMPALADAAQHDVDCHELDGADDRGALCDKHCTPDGATLIDAAPLSLPAALLPAFAMPPHSGAVYRAPASPLPPHTPVDPPPTLRYCTLLI